MQQLSFLPGEMTTRERSLILRALKTLDRHLHEPGVAFTSTRAAREWLILNLAGLEREECRVLYLINQNQLIAGETLFTGAGTMQQLSFLPGEMTTRERSLILRALKTLDRHLHEPGVAFTSTRAAREWLILNLAGLEREECRVLYLINQNQLIAGETLFTGTINRTELQPRHLIKLALYHNAAAVVLPHNHPSGEVTPSKADRLITERLVQALGLVDIRVPDHLIVGGNQVFSFAEHGLLSQSPVR